MAYYFLNTDAKSLGRVSPHDKWIKHGFAFTGGPIVYGKKLGRLSPGDICLMYANLIGMVAIGRVLEEWDGKTYTSPIVYTSPHYDEEYRIRVDWYLDLRKNPIAPSKLIQVLGWNPRVSVQRVRKEEAKIVALVEEIARKAKA